MRNEIKDFYYKDKKQQEEKAKRKENNQFSVEDEDSIDEYLNDNSQKRMYLKFYRYFERKYKYEICPMKSISFIDNNFFDDGASKNKSKISQSVHTLAKSKLSNNTYTEKSRKDTMGNAEEPNEEIEDPNAPKKFWPGEVLIKEKSSNFIKWISSIFQTINDLEISDYMNVTLIFYFYSLIL